MKNLCYDLLTADFDFGVKLHPQDDMKRLGYKVIKCEPVPIADCWWFRVENDIENRPEYLRELKDDFKFSDECDESWLEQHIPRPLEFNSDGTLTDYGKYLRGIDFRRA